jgi:hypothetical protein
MEGEVHTVDLYEISFTFIPDYIPQLFIIIFSFTSRIHTLISKRHCYTGIRGVRFSSDWFPQPSRKVRLFLNLPLNFHSLSGYRLRRSANLTG